MEANWAFPGAARGKRTWLANAGDVRDMGVIPGWGRSPGEGEWLTTPVFLPGEFQGQRSLAGYTVHGVTKGQT